VNNKIASVTMQAFLCNARDLHIEPFGSDRSGTQLIYLFYRGGGRFAYFVDASVAIYIKFIPRFF